MADINDYSQNVSIHNESNDNAVTTSTDGSKERLDVSVQDNIDVTVTDSESPTRYQLKSDYDATGTSVASSPDTTLYTFSGSGVLDLVAVNCLTSANWGVDIYIDGTSRIRITMPDLGSDLGLTNSDYDIVAETANKQFRYHPIEVGFTTSFTIKAFATGATVTLNHLILFRERTASP